MRGLFLSAQPVRHGGYPCDSAANLNRHCIQQLAKLEFKPKNSAWSGRQLAVLSEFTADRSLRSYEKNHILVTKYRKIISHRR